MLVMVEIYLMVVVDAVIVLSRTHWLELVGAKKSQSQHYLEAISIKTL